MHETICRTQINAPAERVWRALCDPTEVATWDTGVTAALDAPPDYPQPGQRVRWSYRSRLFPTLHDCPQEVVPNQRLRSILNLGPYEMNETYTLSSMDAATRLELKIILTSHPSYLGTLFDMLRANPVSIKGLMASLESLKRHCESNQH